MIHQVDQQALNGGIPMTISRHEQMVSTSMATIFHVTSIPGIKASAINAVMITIFGAVKSALFQVKITSIYK